MNLRRLREPSFTVKVGMMTLVPLILLAVVLGKSLGDGIRARALDNAEGQAALIARTTDEGRLGRAADGATSPVVRRRLDRAFRRTIATGEVSGVQLLNRRGRVVYASDPALEGSVSRAPRLLGALKGEPASGTAPAPEKPAKHASEAAEPIEVYTPVRTGSGAPAGALRVEIPAAPVEAAISSEGRRLYAILFAGLALLCLGLLRTVKAASSRLRDQAAENEHQAQRDALTGLPNRALFNRLLDQALASCPRNGQVAVLLMDLDRFKEINDTLGHYNGDLVLERVGERLRTVLREGDSVARLGGDEFAMLLPEVSASESVVNTAARVHRALEEPFTAGGLTLKIEASIGIALYPEHGEKGGTLLRSADVAMYAAKKAHTGHAVYAPDQQQYSPARLGLVGQLPRAIEQGELVLHYQPKARFSTGAIEGVEALVRWDHPQRGLLLPDEFIPVTEHTQMIRPLTIHVLETALAQVRAWEKMGLDLSVAVNLSTQILLDLCLPDEIEQMLSRVGAPPEKLVVEITESAIVYDPRRAQTVLQSLHDMGLRIMIDDFGTGYSSLVSLKQLPVSAIKIDRSFVMGMEADESDAALVKSTAQLGHNLGLEVVAEGVETPAVWNRLEELGCDFAQGYYLSKPLADEQFLRWLTAYREMFGGVVPTVADPLARPRPRLAGVGVRASAA
ncbi:MAG: EAL domain-containing protein [Thermoleophilaceae bacterium]|nr:EAL domain-containing protein [Thermoleophilaceae bacterium]